VKFHVWFALLPRELAEGACAHCAKDNEAIFWTRICRMNADYVLSAPICESAHEWCASKPKRPRISRTLRPISDIARHWSNGAPGPGRVGQDGGIDRQYTCPETQCKTRRFQSSSLKSETHARLCWAFLRVDRVRTLQMRGQLMGRARVLLLAGCACGLLALGAASAFGRNGTYSSPGLGMGFMLVGGALVSGAQVEFFRSATRRCQWSLLPLVAMLGVFACVTWPRSRSS